MLRFLQNKDLVLKRYQKIEAASGKDDQINITHKEGQTHHCIITPDLTNLQLTLNKLKEVEHATIITYNTKENFDILLKNWEKLVNFKKKFNLYFVNPFSHTLKQWAIYPSTHQMITQGEALKLGLKTLFQGVEATTLKDIEKRIQDG